MQIRLRRAQSVLSSSLALLLLAFVAIPSWAAEKTHLRVDDYQIEAELTPHLHQISARAKVKFTALQDLTVAVFELHNDLRVTRVLDDNNQPLSAERVTQDSTIRVPAPHRPGQGRLHDADLRIRRQARNRRRQPGSRPQTRLHRRRHQLPALRRALVPGERLRAEPLHRQPSASPCRPTCW